MEIWTRIFTPTGSETKLTTRRHFAAKVEMYGMGELGIIQPGGTGVAPKTLTKA
jgi:hypothetical protein